METTMGTIPILVKNAASSDPDGKGPRSCYRLARPLPVFYMSDYSVLGLLVDKLEKAVEVLEKGPFGVTEEGGKVEVAIDDPAHVSQIVQILKDHGIQSEIADVVGGIYQG